MKINYITGEEARVGDHVMSYDDLGRVTLVGEELLAWGMGMDEIQDGRIMVEFEKMGLICQTASDEDLKFIKRIEQSCM